MLSDDKCISNQIKSNLYTKSQTKERGRSKRRWLDKVKDDIKEKGLSADDVYDRATWRRMSSYIDPT